MTEITHTAWLAGFYEGEGYPHVVGRGFGLAIEQRNEAVLNTIQSIFGGTIQHITTGATSYRPGTLMHKWRIHGNNSVELAHELLRFMHHPYKIEQLTKALIVTGHLLPRNDKETVEVAERKEAAHAYYKKYREERRLISEYLKQHPETSKECHNDKNEKNV